jgi:hypothetical protein
VTVAVYVFAGIGMLVTAAMLITFAIGAWVAFKGWLADEFVA